MFCNRFYDERENSVIHGQKSRLNSSSSSYSSLVLENSVLVKVEDEDEEENEDELFQIDIM